MSPQTCLNFCYFGVAAGAIISAVSVFGINHFKGKVATTPPDIEVKSITPVLIYERKSVTIEGKQHSFMNQGLSFIVHVKSSSKPVTVSRLRIRGKVFVSPNFYMSLEDVKGKLSRRLKEWKERKPYVKIDWNAYVDENKSDKNVAAFEDKFICLNLIEVASGGQPEFGWEVPMSDYVGYSDGTKEPSKIRTIPQFDFFFETQLGKAFPTGIRNEVKNGDIQFILEAGSREIVLPYKMFRKPIEFPKKYWDENPVDKIVFLDK